MLYPFSLLPSPSDRTGGFGLGLGLAFLSWGPLFLLKVSFFGFWVFWGVAFSGVCCCCCCCFFRGLFGLVLRKSTSLKPEWDWEVDKPREEAKEATSDLRRSMSSAFIDGLSVFDFPIVAE